MNYDVAVIGGGPAGMIAAGKAAESGARVILLEKNNNPGTKLLITGKNRCNITNDIKDLKILISRYGKKGKFLFSCFYNFGASDAIIFFEHLGLKTKVERGNRVFPASDKSQDVLKALLRYLKINKVKIKLNSAVSRIIKKNNKIKKIFLFNGQEINADKYIIAVGGKSYPTTGSSGDGYPWLKKLGHRVVEPRPALTPVICKETYIKDLEGLSLKNIRINLFENNKKIASRFGEAIFTHNGMSGPIILNLSQYLKEKNKEYLLSIDLKPALDDNTLDKRILNDFKKFNNKLFKNSLDNLLPKKLIPIIIKLSKINPIKKVNLITKEERIKLKNIFKNFSLNAVGLAGFEKAIITKGGADLKEINPQTMQSKIIDNLYLAGEILDIDGPTGGYNLQICWSTGFTAGKNAGSFIN